LLNPKNHKQAKECLGNLKSSCCGGGQQVIELAPNAFEEMQELIREYWQSRQEETAGKKAISNAFIETCVAEAECFLKDVEAGNGFPCPQCEIEGVVLKLLFPCGHALCAECVNVRSLICPVCNSGPFEPNKFAWLQPGISVHWRETMEEQMRASKNAYASSRLPPFPSRLPSEAKSSSSSRFEKSYESYLSSRTTSSSSGFTSHSSSSTFCPPASLERYSLAPPTAAAQASSLLLDEYLVISTKASHIVNRVSELMKGRHRRKACTLGINDSGQPSKVKCLIFSAMQRTLNLVGTSLMHLLGRDAVAEHWGKWKESELRKFTEDKVWVWDCPKCGHENDSVCVSCQQEFVKVRVHNTDNGEPGNVFERVKKELITGDFLGRRFHVGETVIWNNFEDGKGSQSGTVVSLYVCHTRRSPEVSMRSHEVDCAVLLLGKDGSHGLDLSMVSHIFIVEKLWDPALENQVVARAWRMGSKQKEVVVEQLLLRGSLEEHVHNLPEIRPNNITAEVMENLKFIRT